METSKRIFINMNYGKLRWNGGRINDWFFEDIILNGLSGKLFRSRTMVGLKR